MSISNCRNYQANKFPTLKKKTTYALCVKHLSYLAM